MVIPPGAGCQGSPPADGSGCGTPASTADNARPAWSTRGRRSRQSRPVASDWFSASTAATSSWSRLRTCPDRVLLRSSGARSASSSQRRTRSLSAASTAGSQRDNQEDEQRPANGAQPLGLGGSWRASSRRRGWGRRRAGTLGRGRGRVAVLVRVGRVGAVAATLGSGGCRSVRSWGGSPSRPRRRRATAEPKDQDQDEPGQKPCPTCPTAKDRCSRPPVPVSGRGWDSPRQHPQDIRIDDHLRIGQGRRGNHARQATPAVLWPGSVCGITRSG